MKFGKNPASPNTVDDKTWKRVQTADIDRAFDTKADAQRMEHYSKNHQKPRNS